MSKTNDTGHNKDVANFETLIAFLTEYGAVYNPSNVNIQLSNLKNSAALALSTNQQVNDMAAKNSNAIAARDLAFETLKKLSTRIMNAVKASDVAQQVIDNVATHHRKMQGQRASAKLNDDEKQKLAASGVIVNQISASQQGFDSLVDTFDKLIKLLATIPNYAPNEVDLQQITLSNLYASLLNKNRDVIANNSQLSTFRVNRDKILYDAETGIVALAFNVKNYVKSIFGSNNPQYKQISGIPFKSVKI